MITNLAKKKKRGFTLVEVIIVLAIIAIIAAIAIPNLTQVRTQSKIKADTQSAETIRKTVITLITEDSIKVKTSGDPIKFYFKFTSGKISDLATNYAGTTAITESSKDSVGIVSTVTYSYINKYFTDMKAPQTDGATNYEVIIDNSGSVTVTVVNSSGVTTGGIVVN